MSKERDRPPWAIWLGCLAAALLAHAVMLLPSSSALRDSLERPLEPPARAKVTDFELVEEPPVARLRPVEATRGLPRPSVDSEHVAERDADVERETQPAPRPASAGGQSGRPQPADSTQPSEPRESTDDDRDHDGDDDERGQAEHAALVEADDGSAAKAGAQARETLPPTTLAGSPAVLRGAFLPPSPAVTPTTPADPGPEPLLDSKRHRFAAFFKRVHQAIVREWSPQAVADAGALESLDFGDARTSVLAIELELDGSLHAVKLARSSDILELDEEAVRALEAAAPFLNPPKALAEDGLIHFRVAFVVTPDGGLQLRRDR